MVLGGPSVAAEVARHCVMLSPPVEEWTVSVVDAPLLVKDAPSMRLCEARVGHRSEDMAEAFHSSAEAETEGQSHSKPSPGAHACATAAMRDEKEDVWTVMPEAKSAGSSTSVP